MTDEYVYADDGDMASEPYGEGDGDDTESVNSQSLTLENPYDMHHSHRQNVGDKKVDALKKWKKKVKIWAALLLLCSGVLMYSDIWYANVIGFAAGGIAIYGAHKENAEFLFVYLVLLFLELLKNAGVFFYFVSGNGSDMFRTILSCSFVVIEEFIVVPFNIFYAFKLYRTLKISNDSDLDETLSNANWQ